MNEEKKEEQDEKARGRVKLGGREKGKDEDRNIGKEKRKGC